MLLFPRLPVFRAHCFSPREGTTIKAAELNPADLAACPAHLQIDGMGGGVGTEAQVPQGMQ